jgi:DNA-binding transcriptional LysR family regulator
VAESLHFGKAAERLGISQPALSQQVQRLEQEFGVILLRRTSRTTSLTPAGHSLLEPLRRCLAAYDEAINLAKLASMETGQDHLRIGVPSLEAGIILEPLLRRVVHLFPDTRLELTECSCEQEPAAIREERLDAGFVHLPSTGVDLGHMVVRKDELVVLLPRNHPFGDTERIDIRKIEDEPFIEFRAQCPAYSNEIRRLVHSSGFVPQVEYVSTGLAGLVEMVSLRLGIAIVPGSSISRKPSGVIARRLCPASKTLDLAFVWRHERATTSMVQLLGLIEDMAHEHNHDREAVAAGTVHQAA